MLQLDELTIPRARFTVRVRGLRLHPGSRVHVVGPSGCGKSSFLRALVGLEPAACTSGLRWHEQDLADAAPHLRPFGWMPQELGLWPHMDAAQHIAFARSRGASLRICGADEELLQRVGLNHRARALPGELSGGEQQRLAFARVMALGPAWAVLDEPFSHLDPVTVDELAALFQEHAELQGMGLIQVTHQLRTPGDDDWMLVIENGALVQQGCWRDVRLQPTTPWLQRFVALQR